jgi:hypothetical protein
MTPFTAATRNVCAVPLVSPVTVALVAVETESLNVAHVEPELLRRFAQTYNSTAPRVYSE